MANGNIALILGRKAIDGNIRIEILQIFLRCLGQGIILIRRQIQCLISFRDLRDSNICQNNHCKTEDNCCQTKGRCKNLLSANGPSSLQNDFSR